MLFFVLDSRLSDTKFFDSDPFGGDIASQGHLRWPTDFMEVTHYLLIAEQQKKEASLPLLWSRWDSWCAHRLYGGNPLPFDCGTTKKRGISASFVE